MNEIIPVLQKLTEFEKGLNKVKLSPSSKLRVDINDTLDFAIDGKSFQSKITHQIIHQLGNR